MELMFILFLRYLQKVRSQQLARAAQLAGAKNLSVPLSVK